MTQKPISANTISRSFPPRRDYVSLSVKDLLDAREAYHIYLSSLKNVCATAIGRYLIHEKDWYATHAPNHPRPKNKSRIKEAKTLANSVIRPWSWPCVLVFVDQWEDKKTLGADAVPQTLYLSDGRVVPVCVVEMQIDDTLPPPASGPVHSSPLLGGGYTCKRVHQHEEGFGTITCLVKKKGTYYALTNSHVAGGENEKVSSFIRNRYHPIGKTSNMEMERAAFNELFPGWANYSAKMTIDAGLIRIDNIQNWTAQVFGIGEIDEVYDATPNTITLDLITCPVKGFGGYSGRLVEGEIKALFYRFQSLGQYDYSTDVLIGPRFTTNVNQKEIVSPFTQPGDSGMLWFYDPQQSKQEVHDDDLGQEQHIPAQGARAGRFIPVAMQWGGGRMLVGRGKKSAFAMGTFISSVCRLLDVEIVRDYSLGHDEYWGKLGHTTIGFKACDLVSGNLKKLMTSNQDLIGTNDTQLKQGGKYKIDKNNFVPLSDVPDYIWVSGTRKNTEPMQHFADIDIYDIDGGETLLDKCIADPSNISAEVWLGFFNGFKDAGVGPDPGCLPFRVWQIYEAMVSYLKKKDVLHFVAAAGVLAHYVGDASQPLHCSYMHHGIPPMIKVKGRKYPIRKEDKNEKTPEWQKFSETKEYGIHGIYEEQMLEIDMTEMLRLINQSVKGRLSNATIKSGKDAATETIKLMKRSQKRLSPEKIIKADDPNLTPKQRAARLWNNPIIRKQTAVSIADSIKVLALIWSAAWKNGNGQAIAASALKVVDKEKLVAAYRTEKNFIPSLTLKQMVASGKFI
jgi:hypothetical protein